MAYAVAQEKGSSPALTSPQGQDAGSSMKSQLRGMSFDEGAAALSPNTVQMMPDANASQSHGAVQLKGGKKKDWEKKKDLPDEIKALGLKKVKVHLEPGAWDHLDEDEKRGVIKFLSMKEAEIQSADNKKSSFRIKKSDVKITASKVKAVDEPDMADLEAAADKNVANLNAGAKPEKTHPKGSIIGVDPGNVTVEQTYTTSTEMVGGKKKVSEEADFKSDSSTFLSAEYTQEKMLRSAEVQKTMELVKAQIMAYLARDPNAKITVAIEGSESWVTPPASHPNRGDLAQARADNGEQLVRNYLAGVEGLDLSNVEFTKTNVGVQGPKWNPQGLSKSEVQQLKLDPMYTRWQYVNFKVAAEMEVESGEEVPVTTTTVDEKQTADADLVKMSVSDKKETHKSKTKKSRGKKYGYQANQGRARRKKVKHKGGPASCPSF